jgi:ribonucleoside-diphosphate reductase alpha chain
MGVNPCGEIILRPNQFCNLSEVVIKEHDNFDTLLPKVEAATIFGILQSTLTKFNFIRKEWIDNTEEERLLGVSLTGICDNNQLGPGDYRALRDYAWRVAEKWADRLSINCPKAITCVKPSGTVSQLVNSASGIHPRYSKYYIRRVRVNATDPIANYLIDKGVTWNPEVGQLLENHTTKVFDFPIASPEGCVTRNDMSAIDQLEHWRELADNWCDHNPSATIYVKDDEWVEVGAWVYRNWEYIGGLSFLPYASGNYPLAPYEEISYDEYERLKLEFPKDIDFERDLPNFEKSDETEGAREFACIGGACEI